MKNLYWIESIMQKNMRKRKTLYTFFAILDKNISILKMHQFE